MQVSLRVDHFCYLTLYVSTKVSKGENTVSCHRYVPSPKEYSYRKGFQVPEHGGTRLVQYDMVHYKSHIDSTGCGMQPMMELFDPKVMT